MYSQLEIDKRTDESAEKLQKLYGDNLGSNYNLEYQQRIQNIQQKISKSLETPETKEKLDILLDTIKDIDYLLSLKKEFGDNKNLEQLKIESDFIAIECSFLYLSYCLRPSNIQDITEDYINNCIPPLEIISRLLIFKKSVLYQINPEKLKEYYFIFIKLDENSKVFTKVIDESGYSFEEFNDLKIKLSNSLQLIYGCLFILNEVGQERNINDFSFNQVKNFSSPFVASNQKISNFDLDTQKSKNQKAIEVLDSFVENGESNEQKETWEEIKPGLIENKAELTAIIEAASEGGYWAICPEVPGANGQGETVEEAKESLKEAIKLIFEDRLTDIRRGLPKEAIEDKILIS